VRILIHPRSITADRELRTRVEEAVSTALDPVRPYLEWVDLYLTDVNGPRRGPDKRSRLVAHLRSGPVVVSRTGTDLVATVAAVAARCRRLIRSRLARRRHRLRRVAA